MFGEFWISFLVSTLTDRDRFNKHIDTLFLITHTSTFNISLQALLLILQITTSMGPNPSSTSLPTSITDRFYRTLYASLFDPRLSVSSKQAMYLNLLFKSLKVYQNPERIQAFVRRFIQVLATGGGGGGAEFIVGGLYLLGEVSAITLSCPRMNLTSCSCSIPYLASKECCNLPRLQTQLRKSLNHTGLAMTCTTHGKGIHNTLMHQHHPSGNL